MRGQTQRTRKRRFFNTIHQHDPNYTNYFRERNPAHTAHLTAEHARVLHQLANNQLPESSYGTKQPDLTKSILANKRDSSDKASTALTDHTRRFKTKMSS